MYNWVCTNVELKKKVYNLIKKKKFIIEYVSQKIAIQQYMCNFFVSIGLSWEKSLTVFPTKKKKKVFNSFSPNLLMYATVNYEPKLLGLYN